MQRYCNDGDRSRAPPCQSTPKASSQLPPKLRSVLITPIRFPGGVAKSKPRPRANSPPPEPKPFNGQPWKSSRLPPLVRVSKFSWYRVHVYGGRNYSKSLLLQELRLALAPHTFKAYYLQKETEMAAKASLIFYVNRYSLATELQSKADQLLLPNGELLQLKVDAHTPHITIDGAYKKRLREALQRRYNSHKRSLNLACFHTDELWENVFCSLQKFVCLQAAIAIMAKCMPDLRCLLLDSNYLQDLSAFEGVELLLPQLRCISLDDNELSSLQTLHVFQRSQLTELSLRRNRLNGNPIQLQRELLQLLPQLRQLNGVLVTQGRGSKAIAGGVSVWQAVGKAKGKGKGVGIELAKSHATYLVQESAMADMQHFLREYLAVFDASTQRSGLKRFYHERALVSLTVAKDALASCLQSYSAYNRNLLDEPVIRLQASRAAALDMFAAWPKTVHLLRNFTVDLPWLQPEMVCFSITGCFEEHGSKSQTPLRHYMRSFVLVPAPAGEGIGGYCISNEMINVTVASRAQIQRLSCSKQKQTPLRSNFEQKVKQRSVQSMMVGSRRTVQATQSMEAELPPTEQERQTQRQLVAKLAAQTHMNSQWSRKCLADTNWDYNQAFLAFKELHSHKKIPPEAFRKPQQK